MLMAPPIPGLRAPAVRVHRTAADIAAGVAAVIALAALVAGVPAALVLFLGLPVPRSTPSMSALTGQLDVLTILKILSVVVWLAWLQLGWCVLVEIQAAVRNVGVPSRVPLSGGTQSLAHRLVTAALLLFSVAAALSPAMSHAAAPRPAYAVSAAAQFPGPVTSPGTAAATSDALPAAHAAPRADKLYVVSPPEGRYHESLWEIAQQHLGDGRRYKEIFELNADRVQPDGSKLTIASLIRPGWVLRMPGDADGPGITTVAQHQQQAAPGSLLNVPGGAGHGTGSTGTGSGPVSQQQSRSAWPDELAAASLLAAGVLAALGRHRRQRLWQRAFGRRLAAPAGDAAAAETALRLGADDPAVQRLDTSLRQLAAALAGQAKQPPTVYAAHLDEEHLDLWIAPADPEPPAPWQPVDDGQVWRLPVAATAGLDPAGALAPYPGLVTLGTNETGRIMVDLEVAHGLIAVRGPAETVRSALAALAVELVTNRWSDRMRVTLVGFGEGLEPLAPDRVTVARTLDDALPELERRAADLEGQLAAWGIDSVLTGRSVTRNADAWAPHYLITGVPPTPGQSERLLALSRTRHRTALGLVAAGDVPGASWTWDLTPDGRLQAGVLGFNVAAQLLPAAQYAAVVSLFAAGGDAPITPPSAADLPAPLRPGAPRAVEVGLLGPAVVSAPGPVEPERLAVATELVVYLAAHPAGVHPNVLAGALWPRGVTDDVRDAAVARVRRWLGTDHTGEANLVTDPDGRLRLGSGVGIDWQEFRGLVARANQRSSDAAAAAASLEQALGLVRGQLLDGRDPGRYAWLATDDFSYEATALVADIAHSLSALRLAWGDSDGAMAAARSGLRLAFNDEMLWRDLLRGAHATGQEQPLRAAVDELSARVALDEVMPRMAPETEALVSELLPSWRSSAA
jgi:DNA-binding SARP family transcriptional activator